MHTLLILCSSDYDSLRALNLLGSKRRITVLHREDRANIPCSQEWTYPWTFLTDPEAMERLPTRIRDANFDEIVFLIARPELAETLRPFIRQLPADKIRYICRDRLHPTLESLHDSQVWVRTPNPDDQCEPGREVPLYGIIGSFNEEDVIYSTVRHMLENGTQKVFLIDNDSQDRTRREATAAGAEIIGVYSSYTYNEMQRIIRINDAIGRVSEESHHESIWWTISDADEFIETPDGSKLASWLNQQPSAVRVCGVRQINYFPTETPAYQSRGHPRQRLTYGEIFDARNFVQHCPQWHWKHPVFLWQRNQPEIIARSGFHILSCSKQLVEASQALNLHHFPFREREQTFKRYADLCLSGRNKSNDAVSVGGKSAIQKRFEQLQLIYENRWDEVYIQPGPIKDGSQRGVRPERIPYRGPIW